MDKSRTPEISAENRPVSPTASPVASPTVSPTASSAASPAASASASCSASDTAVCTNDSPISNAAVNTGKVVKVHKCPICGKLTNNAKYRPFCSKRCADIDLGTWFAEGYVIEGKAPIDEEEGE